MFYATLRNLAKNLQGVILIVLSTFVLAASALSCETDQYRVYIVTYFDTTHEVTSDSPFDSRCHYYINARGRRECQIRLRGALFVPLASAYNVPPGHAPAQFPAIVVNHGSEHTFTASTHLCEIPSYFVQRGYIVFAPFRRGQGGVNDENRSTGVYVEDMLTDWQSNDPQYFHDTVCTTVSCYKAQLLRQQADQEIAAAMDYVKSRTDVKTDPEDPQQFRIALMGISYGGAVTVFANRLELGQKAAVPFSPGAQQWAPDNCSYNPDCGTAFQRTLISAAGNAKKPAFYIQAKWDYDTRATIDLAYAHAYLSSIDPAHSHPYNAAIYEYINPCPNRPCTAEDYQSIHAGFFGATAVWGKAVLNFLKRNDVK